ncbi:MAG: helix-turn-helix domain-containing protein [Planctomycetaceae bacterium]|nr:helix-turn-helix domain-containing protein [Planctomycetaceae bacterium]
MADANSCRDPICLRIAQVRAESMGPRGKARFAKALCLSPSTYEYYERSRVPPASVLVKIAQVAGVDLRWLLTGEGSAAAAAQAATNHPALQRAAALIGDYPHAAGPLAAFLDLLAAAMEFPQKEDAGATEGAKSQSPGRIVAPAEGSPQVANAIADLVAEAIPVAGDETMSVERIATLPAGSAFKDVPARSWVPILGRSAAGVPQFWDGRDRAAGVTTLSDLIERHAKAPAVIHEASTRWADSPAAPQTVQIITLTAPADEVSQFVAAADIKARYSDAFAVRIDGDSMSPDIRHGDLVVLSPTEPARDGKAAIVQLDGQIGVTCKLYRRSGLSVHLIPINERVPHTVVAAEAVQWALRVLALVRA